LKISSLRHYSILLTVHFSPSSASKYGRKGINDAPRGSYKYRRTGDPKGPSQTRTGLRLDIINSPYVLEFWEILQHSPLLQSSKSFGFKVSA
jgi:hypothetical protein